MMSLLSSPFRLAPSCPPVVSRILLLGVLLLVRPDAILALQEAQEPPSMPSGEPAAEDSRNQEDAEQADEEWADPEVDLEKFIPLEKLDLEPPAEGWLLDDEGREYFLKELPREEGEYQWVGENRIRYRSFYVFEVERHDEGSFWVKVFKPQPVEIPSEEEVARQAAEERARVAATYEHDTGVADRLSFAPFDRGLPRTGQWRNGFDLADMNGDGHIDIVHGPSRKGGQGPLIFLGNGGGQWRLWREARYPQAPYDYGDAAVADFNGDGLPDVALAFHLRGLLALIQETPGHFATWSEGIDLQREEGEEEEESAGSDAAPSTGEITPAPRGTVTVDEDSTFTSRAIEVADWNGDGRPDILALGEGPRPPAQAPDGRMRFLSTYTYGSVIYLNRGDGTWRRLDQGLDRGRPFGDAITTADFNGDGRLDFATASNVLNRRNILYFGQEDGTWRNATLELARPRAFLQSVRAADFNGDGRDDLVVTYANSQAEVWRSGVDLFYSRPDDSWERRAVAVEEGDRAGLWALDVGDLDGDGRLDIAAFTARGEPWFLLGRADGGFDRERGGELDLPPGGCRAYHARLRDLDGDGRDEVVVAFGGESSALFAPDRCPSGGALRVWRVAEARPGSGGEASRGGESAAATTSAPPTP